MKAKRLRGRACLRPALCGVVFLIGLPAAWAAPPGVITGVTHRDKFYDVQFVGQHAWVVGFPGLILHSDDGGQSFEQQACQTQEALFAIHMLDAQRGFISGRSGLVLATTDGGKTWQRRPTGSSEPLFDVAFADANTGWVVGNFATLLQTRDGGRTWHKQTFGEDEDASLNSVCFKNASEGWIVGEFGTILHTGDGGQQWQRQDSPVSDPLFVIRCSASGLLTAGGVQGILIESRDGGTTWTRLETPTAVHLFGLYRDDKRFWTVGQRGVALEMRQSAFARANAKSFRWLSAIAFAPDNHGVIVGGQATLMSTQDNGRTWRPFDLR